MRSVAILCLFLAINSNRGADQPAVALPAGVQAVWDISKAYHETTPTRERICINGLWQWQPTDPQGESVPTNNWGYFKVPGCWPGITDYMQKDCQRVFAHPAWKQRNLGQATAAWYKREISIPADWAGRAITLRLDYLNSYAAVYIDGKRAGEVHFPEGEVELTSACRPGSVHELSLLVAALPLRAVMLLYTDSASARQVKGSVARRGLCGDVYLVGVPKGPSLGDLSVATSVRQGECTITIAPQNLALDAQYRLQTRTSMAGATLKEFTSAAFGRGDSTNGQVSFKEKWIPERLWDLHTPENLFLVEATLQETTGKTLDLSWPQRFGFREFWVEGRDFFLNGSRIFLSAVPLDNTEVSAGLATYEAARESLRRLKDIGINFVYTHNYNCQPGVHLSFDEVLRAADDVGMLVGLSQPHFSDYNWQKAGADTNNGYLRHADYYVRVAAAHPAVVMYAMSHNATGYGEDMNPDQIDGIQAPRDNWSANNAKLAMRAEHIVHGLDPSRIVYHHASGNLGAMHIMNFYPNFVPIQELSDWFEHWATAGVKPAFTCEYGAPFTWDWTMYRGWYRDQREFGSANVPWEFCVAEWNAQFMGDAAYQLSEPQKANLRWEAKEFRAGKVWHRWDYPYEVGSTRFEERFPVFARYITENWRAFRTWGLSGNSPWEYGHFWKLRDGVDRSRREFKVDWAKLQRPGSSPDYLDQRVERIDLAFEPSDWIATEAAQALLHNNRPLLAYLAGKPEHFTSKDHNFFAGETFEKQIIVINNSRQTVTADCDWSFDLPEVARGSQRVTLPTGQQQRIPLRFALPGALAPGRYPINATVRFSDGQTQTDKFFVDVLPRPTVKQLGEEVALYDPEGQSAALLDQLGIRYHSVTATAKLSSSDLLVVGKAALTVDGPEPDITQVTNGLKVLIFEQSSPVLEKRFGFRVEEYGLRQVFARTPDHPALKHLVSVALQDWRGEATLLPPRLTYEMRPRYGPTVQWCGIPVTRLWRCGNRGNVASVLIEKPACGDFLPILDGGFSLQYSPLLEFREGQGGVVFCQMDVSGRTEDEPAAQLLVSGLLQHLAGWKPAPRRTAVYAGDPQGQNGLARLGVATGSVEQLAPGHVLVLGPSCAQVLAGQERVVADWVKHHGKVLALGLDQKDAALLSLPVTLTPGEHISTFFTPFPLNSILAGISPAEVLDRDPRERPLLSSGAQIVGDGVLGLASDADVVFCQLAPWQYASQPQPNTKRTWRRSSFLVSRLLANLGAGAATPILERFHKPEDSPGAGKRWLSGLYVDQPEEWDDPYRAFRW